MVHKIFKVMDTVTPRIAFARSYQYDVIVLDVAAIQQAFADENQLINNLNDLAETLKALGYSTVGWEAFEDAGNQSGKPLSMEFFVAGVIKMAIVMLLTIVVIERNGIGVVDQMHTNVQSEIELNMSVSVWSMVLFVIALAATAIMAAVQGAQGQKSDDNKTSQHSIIH